MLTHDISLCKANVIEILGVSVDMETLCISKHEEVDDQNKRDKS